MDKQILIRFFIITAFFLLITKANVVSFLQDIRDSLKEIGPMLSSIMFAIAGIVYALAQLMPYYDKAKLQATAINLIIGAVVVGVLTLASSNLAGIAQKIVNSS
jgi:hypothetical protein